MGEGRANADIYVCGLFPILEMYGPRFMFGCD